MAQRGTGTAGTADGSIAHDEPGDGRGDAHEMRDDDEVFYMGEDVADYGGIFDSTEGLLEEFGRDRIMDVPISETVYIGAAVGAAQAGHAADCGAHVRRLLRRRHGSDLQPAGQEHLT